MKKQSIRLCKRVVFCLSLILSLGLMISCSGDNDVTTPPAPDNTVNVSTCPTTGLYKTTLFDDACDIPESIDSPQDLVLETEIDAELKSGETRIYKIPSDANVSLVSNSGNADLFLYDNLEDIDTENTLSNQEYLCRSLWGFKEDVCTASVDDGELYALVEAVTDTRYRIGTTAECSIETVNRWVYRNMLDYYLYANEVPEVNPDTFTDSYDLVKALRFEDLDPFSYIGDAQSYQQFFDEGALFGLGYSWESDVNNNIRIILTFTDSAFGRAGIKRGDTAISINGELVNDMSSERYSELVGTRDNPLTSTWEFIDGKTGEMKTVSVTSAEYFLNSVVHSGVFEAADSSVKVGNIVFTEFIAPSADELDSVIEDFKEKGVTELVLDLRYNGGGLSWVSQRLASQLGGPALDGKLLSREEHNDKYSQFDYPEFFVEASPSLALNRLIVLTTERTASASERLISALQPYMEVVTIGSTTTGKAFSSNGRRYCGKVLSAMQTQGVNSTGVSVAGGIAADCYASDDTANDFGLGEGMFQSALDYIQNGTCQSQPVIAARSSNELNSKPEITGYPISEEQLLLENAIE